MKSSGKYIFASILIVIGFVFLFVGVGMGASFSDIRYYKTESFDMDFSDQKITSLDIDFSVGNLIIKRGDSFRVVANDIKENSTECRVDGNTLIVNCTAKEFFGMGSFRFDSKIGRITIYIPNDAKFEVVDIDFGVGQLNVSDIEAERFTLESGVGQGNLSNITAKHTVINTGIGEQNFVDCVFNNLNLSTGIGAVNYLGDITGNSSINGGIGAININLSGSYENYGYSVNKGVGDVRINGGQYRSINDSTVTHKISVSNGIGAININMN